MLRHFGEPGGIGVYTTNVLKALLRTDHEHHYLLIYNTPAHLGRFSSFPQVTEKVVPASSKLWWDQIAIPHLARKERLDLIYNPKLSVPFFTRCKTVLVMHGAEQFAVPWAYKWYDRMYFSVANRLYCKRADAIISMTHTGAKDIARYMGANPRKIHVVYEAYNEHCRVLDLAETAVVKKKYSLPERFMLFVGGLNPVKNFGNVLKAYKQVQGRSPHKLVVVGFKRWKFESDLELIEELGLRDQILFTGFVPDDDIPAFYNLADLFLFPSLYEGFGIPVLEAMACGCPVITTKTGCTPEVAGDAAFLVDPYNPDEIAKAIQQVLRDEGLRKDLIEKGLRRAKQFSWEKCARETLAVLNNLHAFASP
jgi:glycosyltransferase involved in cell wall biosynthesis